MIRRFRPLKDSELEGLRAKLSPAVERWAADWLRTSGAGLLRVTRTDPRPLAAGLWQVVGPANGPAAAAWTDEAGAAALAEAILGSGQPGTVDSGHPLLSQLVQAAVQGLLSAIGEGARESATTFGTQAPELAWFRPGLGNALVAVGFGATELLLFLDRTWVDALVGPSPSRAGPIERRPLVGRAAAIRSRRVRLEVHLDETGLSLADIRALQPRDVVRFDHPIIRAVMVRVQAGADLGACYLGRRGTSRAARLVKKEESIA